MSKQRTGKLQRAVLDFLYVRSTTPLSDIVDALPGYTAGNIRRTVARLEGKGSLKKYKVDNVAWVALDATLIPKPKVEQPAVAVPDELDEGVIRLMKGLLWDCKRDGGGNPDLVGVYLNRRPRCLWSTNWFISLESAEALGLKIDRKRNPNQKVLLIQTPALIEICSPNGKDLTKAQMLVEILDMCQAKRDNQNARVDGNPRAWEFLMKHLIPVGDSLAVNGNPLRGFLKVQRRGYANSGNSFFSPWDIVPGSSSGSKVIVPKGSGWEYDGKDKMLILHGTQPKKVKKAPAQLTVEPGLTSMPMGNESAMSSVKNA